MKNNKGFTLVELIAVIAILVVVSGIFATSLSRTLNTRRNESESNAKSEIELMSEIYATLYPEDVTDNELTIGDLINTGLIKRNYKIGGEVVDIDRKITIDGGPHNTLVFKLQ